MAVTLQSAGPGNIDEILTTTLVNMRPGIIDNIFRSNPLLDYFYKKGNGKVKLSGGAAVSHGLMYGLNSGAQAYSRYDTLAVTPVDGLTRDQWEWTQYSVPVTIDGFSERINTGKEKLADIMDEKKKQAEESLSLLLEQDMFASSPTTKHLRSLNTIIASSGTEGSINGTTNTWWSSYTNTSVGSFASNGVAALRTAFNSIRVLNPVGDPKTICSDQTTFEYYEASLTPYERFTDTKSADIGIMNLKFKTAPWFFSPQATSGTVYLLSDSALEFVVHEGTDFKTTEFVKPANQDARTAQILLMCSLTTGNRRKLGKLSGITA